MAELQAQGIVVVGNGISGLTTAVVLLEAGYPVRIIAREPLQATTSATAAAIWHPFMQALDPRFHAAARITYQILSTMVTEPRAGIRLTELREFFRSEQQEPWWADISGAKRIPRAELPSGYAAGFRFQVPVIDTTLYLPYLQARFHQAGGRLELRSLETLDGAAPGGETIVNCSGLGARQLAGDALLGPWRGHILRVALTPGLSCCYIDDSEAAKPTYIIPRFNDCILGGTSQPGMETAEFTDEVEADILARCNKLVPDLGEVTILERRVGFRPARPSLRLERDPRKPSVIHNYGHGGSGFTVSWGCAVAIRDLLQFGPEPHFRHTS